MWNSPEKSVERTSISGHVPPLCAILTNCTHLLSSKSYYKYKRKPHIFEAKNTKKSCGKQIVETHIYKIVLFFFFKSEANSRDFTLHSEDECV